LEGSKLAANTGRFFLENLHRQRYNYRYRDGYEGDDMDGHRFVEVSTTDIGARGSVRLLADIFSAQRVTSHGTTIAFYLPERFWPLFHNQLREVGHLRSVRTYPPVIGERIYATALPARYQAN
jgi:uncharacterized membrane protein